MEHGGGHDVGAHKVAQLFGLTFNMDTLMMTWLTMAIVLVIAYLATRRLSMNKPSRWQSMLELIIESLLAQIEANMGKNGLKLAPLIITLFMFLLVANWLGLIPGFTSPTNDLNTAAGLAIMVFFLMQALGVINKGLIGYYGHFVKPYAVFLPINIIEELSKPLTLSFRLFGNILAGEILLMVLGMLVPYLIPTAWLAFSVFVGVVQAFIFTMLSMSYLANSVSEDKH